MDGQTTTFSMRLTPQLRGRLDAEAARTGLSKAQVASKALDEVLPEDRYMTDGEIKAKEFFSWLDGVHAKLRAEGYVGRSQEEIDASIRELRADRDLRS